MSAFFSILLSTPISVVRIDFKIAAHKTLREFTHLENGKVGVLTYNKRSGLATAFLGQPRQQDFCYKPLHLGRGS